MYKTATRKKLAKTEFDLYNDLEKIKSALTHTAYDVKGRAGEILTNSIEDMRDRTSVLQDNIADYVTKKPVKTLGLTLLTGLIIGYIIHR